jgi:peptidoglycan hydrolase-like protein with peptidoglycan-binding domain
MITPPTLRRGAQGDEVCRLQAALIELGARTCVDGYFGPKTERWVKELQQACGLAADGVVDPATWAAIDGRLAVTRAAAPPRRDPP